ncbi:MAG: hypothetical protein ACRDYB_16435, partial [Acidimicrobiales bacterium]
MRVVLMSSASTRSITPARTRRASTKSGWPHGRGGAAETGSVPGRARSAISARSSRLAPLRACQR